MLIAMYSVGFYGQNKTLSSELHKTVYFYYLYHFDRWMRPLQEGLEDLVLDWQSARS